MPCLIYQVSPNRPSEVSRAEVYCSTNRHSSMSQTSMTDCPVSLSSFLVIRRPPYPLASALRWVESTLDNTPPEYRIRASF